MSEYNLTEENSNGGFSGESASNGETVEESDASAVGPSEFTRFRIDVLAVLDDGRRKGTDVKDGLDEYYDKTVGVGQIYQNLDWLAEHGLIERRENIIDGRTNLYEITSKGRRLLYDRLEWLATETLPETVEETGGR